MKSTGRLGILTSLATDVSHKVIGDDDDAPEKKVPTTVDTSDFWVIISNNSTDRSLAQPLESMMRLNFRFWFMARLLCEWFVAQLHLGQTGEAVTKVILSINQPVLHVRYEKCG